MSVGVKALPTDDALKVTVEGEDLMFVWAILGKDQAVRVSNPRVE